MGLEIDAVETVTQVAEFIINRSELILRISVDVRFARTGVAIGGVDSQA